MASICNNDVTYAEHWDTPENNAALLELERKYFDMSECRPDCPVSWAPEVLEMMNNIHQELGFRYNESTIRGYYIQGTPKDWFLVNPWKGFFYAFKSNMFGNPTYRGRNKTTKRFDPERRSKTLYMRISAVAAGFFDPIKYGFRALRVRYVNPFLNKVQKRKVRLGQLKEKYGYLTLYYSCGPAYKEFIENEQRKCAVKLAMKGAYYPIESLWDAGTKYNIENEYEPDSITVEVEEYNGKRTVSVTQTTYRKVMKELGLNLKEIEDKAILRKASKADPV